MKDRAPFIVFIFLFLLILGFVNAVTYESILLIFHISSHAYQMSIGSALGLLTLGFIAAMFLGMKFYNIVTRSLYITTSQWMGTLVYFFFSSLCIGILSLVQVSGSVISFIGTFLFVLSTVVSIYGIFHARTIKIKKVEVSLPHLPEAWTAKKLVWISDVHLGQVYGKSFIESIVKKIESIKPDIVIIGGDLFDGTKAPPLHDFVSPLKALTVPQGIFFISGNHEEFGDAHAFFDAVQSVGIRILSDESVNIDGVQLIGVDYHNTVDRNHFTDILTDQHITKQTPSLLFKHEPRNLDIAEAAGVSLSISGHTHYGQQFPFGLLASSIYKGYAYGLKSLKTMEVYVSSGVGSWGPALRIGSNSEIVVFHFVQKN